MFSFSFYRFFLFFFFLIPVFSTFVFCFRFPGFIFLPFFVVVCFFLFLFLSEKSTDHPFYPFGLLRDDTNVLY